MRIAKIKMSQNSYSYKTEMFTCNHCAWIGLGEKTKMGDVYKHGFEIVCPQCEEQLSGLILFPTIEETLEKGSDWDKLRIKAMETFQEKWLDSLLKDISQLPDLPYDLMAFVLSEIKEEGENYIIISYKDKLIWKEIRAYEYYERFIELGKLFKRKYGDKMIDLVPNVNGNYLYGDSGDPGFIRKFRETLIPKKTVHSNILTEEQEEDLRKQSRETKKHFREVLKHEKEGKERKPNKL